MAIAEPSEASSEYRRKGLTTPERACMSKYGYLHTSNERMLRKVESRLGQQRRRRPAPVAATPLPPEAGGGALSSAAEPTAAPGRGWTTEELCGDILDQILPLPQRSGRPAVRRCAIAAGFPARAREAPPSSHGATPSRLRPPSGSAPGGGRDASGAAPVTPPELQLIRRHYDLESIANSNMGRNVIRLVQGARATKVEREVGGNIRFIFAAQEQASPDELNAFNEACAVSGSKRSPNQQLKVRKPDNSHVHGSGYRKGMQEVTGHPLHEFRRRMLSKYSTTAEAFDAINLDSKFDSNKLLDMREWCEVLVKAGMTNMLEARVIFELMDVDHDGSLTMHEFNIGVEAVAPVTTLSALRKRFICLGFSSMLQAIAVMNGLGEDTTMRPLTQSEFAASLRRVWVIEENEHRSIFNLVRDQCDPSGRASLCDLACGLAAVSPCILVAEARSQLIQKWGSLPAAYEALEDEWLQSVEAFEEHGSEWLNMSRAEAAKIFRLTDIDRSGHLSRAEVAGVMRLSQASIQVEDTRRVVQQSYRGIEAALRESFLQGSELDDELRFSVEELMDLLQRVDMPQAEKRRLVNFLAATHEEGMTLYEFFIGIRLFAPSCALEGVRLQLLQSHDRVVDAFRHIRNRRQPLSREELRELFRSLGVVDLSHFDIIFDLLDVRSSGLVTVTELMAALRSSESGTRRWLGEKEREELVEHRVRGDLAELREDLSELKRGLRSGLDDSQEMDLAPTPSAVGAPPAGGCLRLPTLAGRRSRSVPTNLTAAFAAIAADHPSPGVASAPSPSNSWAVEFSPAARSAAEGSFRDSPMRRTVMRKTFHKFRSSLDRLPEEQKELKTKTMDTVRSYFASEQQVLKAHEPMVNHSFSKAALFSEMSHLQSMGRLCGGKAAPSRMATLSWSTGAPALTPTASASSKAPAGGSFAAKSQSLPALQEMRAARCPDAGGGRRQRLPLAA